MARQRVSDQLKHQDQRTAAGLLIAVQALAERYPQSLELKGASRDLADFAKALEEKPAPLVSAADAKSLVDVAFPSSEVTGA